MARPSSSRKKVVNVGGGNGTYMTADGLRDKNVEITVLSTPADSGGDSGDIRNEIGEILPPGDMRRGINALIDPRYSAQTRRWLDRRIPIGNGKNRNVGNFIISSAMKEFGVIEGLKFVEELLHVRGTVLPMSNDDVQLVGKLDDGSLIRGETNIDTRPLDDERLLVDAWLEPSTHIHRDAAEALYDADLITIGPGDLYSSIAGAMKVKGFKEVMADTKAIVVAIPSLMSKWSETRGYHTHDFVGKMAEWLGREFDSCIVNAPPPPEAKELFNLYHELLKKYAEGEKSTPMLVRDRTDHDKLKQFTKAIHPVDLLSKKGLEQGLIRHDSRKTASAIMDLLDARSPVTVSGTPLQVSESSAGLLKKLEEVEHTLSPALQH